MTGAARFALVDGRCEGELVLAGALAAYFGNGPQSGSDRARVVALADDSNLSRAGLVTPFGIYDLRAGADGTFASPVSRSRTLSFSLVE
ncbi:hypothetical protein J4558_14870 [Leptolyngbya sp. 15MV]|nr:hypothetical protein J4558_14870 [Leptolyngbya sp. 15MV]